MKLLNLGMACVILTGTVGSAQAEEFLYALSG